LMPCERPPPGVSVLDASATPGGGSFIPFVVDNAFL
jgi:hypothetical protein